MKLLERLVEKTLGRSTLLLATAGALQELATEVHKLGQATMVLARTVRTHQVALQELYARQDQVIQAIKSNSLDVRMPDPSDKEPVKPN